MPSMTTLVDGTVPVAADFNGNYSALNAAIGVSTTISAWALGELPYASAANTLARLTPGSAGQVLTMQGTGIPGWSTATITDQLTGLGMSNGTDATNDIDVAVGAAASDDATVANRILMNLTSVTTKQLDAAWAVGTNQGGRDTGAISDATWHVFLIERTDTGVVDVLYSLSPTAPTMPTSYTKQRRIGSIVRTAGAIKAFKQNRDYFDWVDPTLDVNNATPGTSANTATFTLPTGLVLIARINSETDNTGFVYWSPLDMTDSAASLSAAPLASNGASGNSIASQVLVRTNTSAQARYRNGANVGTRAATLGWIDFRGKG